MASTSIGVQRGGPLVGRGEGAQYGCRVAGLTDERGTRRRRQPEAARQEILDAAEELLTRLPFHQVTVSEVMRHTTLSRKSFYVYFRDQSDLLGALVAPVRRELDDANEVWLRSETKGHDAGRATLVAVGEVMKRRGRLLRTLAEAARHDPEMAALWGQFVEPAVEAYTARIRHEIGEGRVHGVDAEATARALLAMNYAVFFEQIVDNPKADLDLVASTLATIWTRTLYLASPR
jgi:AcrR family transcriptional regulator